MRIGIDASRAFVDNPTGTERYSYEVITRLLKLPEAKKHTWILYVRPQFLISNFKFLNNDQMFKCPNVQIREIPLSRLWTQVGLAARTWVDDLDVLWVPAHTLPVLRKLGIRTVVTVHGLEYEWLPEYENWLQRWYLPLSTKYAVMSASRIIAVSEFTKRQLVERLGADERKIAVIHEGVTRQRLETSVQRLVKGKYLLFVGTIQPRKNLVRLIEAFSRLDARRYTLVIAGKLGWMYDEVVTLAKKHKVVITGCINEAERYGLLRNALVYVQPSITEGFGLPVLEAMAAGVPVVSSSGGALAEVVGDAGVLFEPYDVNDMSHKLSLVIHSHSLQEELIKKGRERVKQFSWEKAARETYRILISKS